jgi:hypothetical protein
MESRPHVLLIDQLMPSNLSPQQISLKLCQGHTTTAPSFEVSPLLGRLPVHLSLLSMTATFLREGRLQNSLTTPSGQILHSIER